MNNKTKATLSPEGKNCVERMASALLDVMDHERPLLIREFLDTVSVEAEKEKTRANSRVRICDEILSITGSTAPAVSVKRKAKR